MTYSQEQYDALLVVCRSYKQDYEKAQTELKLLKAEIDYKNEAIRNAVKISEEGEKELVKIRKETAREILNDLYFNLQSSVKGKIAKSNDYYNVMGWIEEIAKKYGVEIPPRG